MNASDRLTGEIHRFHKHRILLILTFLAAIYFDLCAQSKKIDEKAALEEAKKAIAASNEIYFDSFVKNDSSIFINRYAKDACIMAPNAPAICGHVEAAEFFRSAYRDYGLRNGKFITTAVYGDAKEYVVEEGMWESFDANGKLFDDGKFLVLWKKTSEGWKMFRDSFSSNNSQK